MAGAEKLSEAEAARRAEAKRQSAAEKRTARRIVVGNDGSVAKRLDLKAKGKDKAAVRQATPAEEEQARLRAEAQAAAHLERRKKYDKESAEFRRNLKKIRKQRRAIGVDIANTGIEIARVSITDPLTRSGRHVWVNKVDGYLIEQHNRQPKEWTLPMVDGGNRFAAEYAAAAFRGLGCAGFEPRVDNSGGGGDNSVAVGAMLRLRDLKRTIGAESYLILELVCGLGFTLSELHSKGLGQKGTLGDRLRKALEEAAAFYRYLPEVPPSKFIRDAHALIERLKNQV